jgi:dephospho-CoA kinase
VPGGQARRVAFAGLTGGLGAGKSTALTLLAELGAATLSTDSVVHELYGTDPVRDAVVERWGAGVAPGGTVDRRAVAAKAFAADGEREWLEQLLWPLVRERVNGFRDEAADADPLPRAIVVEAPLLFEAESESGYDATIAVVAAEALRSDRARDRGHSDLDARTSRQLTQAEKAQRATYTVRNDGSPEELKSALADLLVQLEESVK